MKNSVIAIQSFVITTIVYALLVPVFFEMDNAFGEENFVFDNGNSETIYSQQLVEIQNVNLLVHLLKKCASKYVHRID